MIKYYEIAVLFPPNAREKYHTNDRNRISGSRVNVSRHGFHTIFSFEHERLGEHFYYTTAISRNDY